MEACSTICVAAPPMGMVKPGFSLVVVRGGSLDHAHRHTLYSGKNRGWVERNFIFEIVDSLGDSVMERGDDISISRTPNRL